MVIHGNSFTIQSALPGRVDAIGLSGLQYRLGPAYLFLPLSSGSASIS